MNRIFKVGLMYLILMFIIESGPMLLGGIPANVMLFFSQYIVIALPVILLAVILRMNLKERFKLNGFKLKTLPYIFIVFLAAIPVNTFLSELTTFIFGTNPSGIDAFTAGLNVTPYQELFILAITPAFCEELMFRGLLLDKKSGLNMHGLALLSGLMFSMFHVGYDQLFYTFALGVIFAYAAIITGSIFPAMILHFLNNGFGTILTIITGPSEVVESAVIEPVVAQASTFTSLLPMFVVAVVGGIIIFFVYKKLIKIYEYDDCKRLEENKEEVELIKKSKVITFLPQAIMFVYVLATNILR